MPQAGRSYNNPNTTPSSIGATQFNTFYFQKKALIEAKKEQYFSQLADTTSMPKHMGKMIKRYHYIPLLDDANLNDQGIDAAGVVITSNDYFVQLPYLTWTATDATVATNTRAAINAIEAGVATGSGTTVTVSKLSLVAGTLAEADAVLALVPGSIKMQGSGNLYGSSKDVGAISGKLPLLGEHGGRVNRVGFKRKELSGSFEKFGFFDEYTQESMDFDSDEELMSHINREMVNGATEMTEDALQIDLLTNAGVVKWAGGALATNAINSKVTYGDLMRLSIDLDNNRCPKQTTMITGTRMVDTKVIPGARVAYIGSELIPTFRAMVDLHNQPAFIPVEKYAAGTTVLNGEIGAVDSFRIVVVPEMMKWVGAGAAKGADTTHYGTNGRFDVFPILVVGDQSFTTIGFQTDGKSSKFTTYHIKPGEKSATRDDPYGETGFMSIKWYYGFMVLRPERIAVFKTAALI